MKLFTPSRFAIRGRDERGYMLITIILFVALLAIAMTAAAPLITRQVKRDREEEMIHRGTQYSRAIKHYVKKFGRYPTKIEDLENTNNVRFLRRRYKDPITGKDFKLLHMGEVQTAFGSSIAGATSVTNLAAAQASSGGLGNSSAFGNNSSFGGSAFGGNSGSTFGGGSPGSSFGGSTFGSSFGNSPQSATTPQGNQAQNAGTDSSSVDQKVSGQSEEGPTTAGTKVFGGGPILGVASLSKEKSIRVFSKKDHYNQWQFIYDPTLDGGGLITTPFQPGMQSAGVMQQGVQGQPGTQNSPFGTQGSSFGQGSAFGQGSSFGSPGGTMSSPAPSQPQPQGFQSPFPPEQGPQQ